MGFSILGFEEDNPSQLGLVNRPHVLVENGDEGRHCDQMVVLTAEDDVRDTASSTNVPTVRDMPSDGYPYSHRASAGVANNSSTILGDMTIFRDFFLAAFSDYNVACCGGESIFDDQPCNTNGAMPRKNSFCSSKLAQPGSDTSSYHSYHHPTHIRTSSLIGRTTSSLSQNSAQNNASHDSGAGGGTTTKRRQRPLAVAVGFKYAEDINGRPIIITPGNRLMPIRGPRSSPSSSPSSQPINYTLRKDVTPNVLFPFEHEYATNKNGSQSPSPLSYKPTRQLQHQHGHGASVN